MYAYVRRSIYITNSRLRRLATAVDACFMRVSEPGQIHLFQIRYCAICTSGWIQRNSNHQQWRGVVDFSRQLGADRALIRHKPGTRDAAGVWAPTNTPFSRLYTLMEHDRSRRVHERAELAETGRCTSRYYAPDTDVTSRYSIRFVGGKTLPR